MNDAYRQITKALEDLLSDIEHKIEPPPRDVSLLFLLSTFRQNKVCFALINDNYEESSQSALDEFRGLYALHATDWADYDLFLVLVSKNIDKIPDEFCRKIEIDPYFCRKFIISCSRNLKNEIRRMPFIPLRPESISSRRPVIAQTLLSRLGLPTELGRYLVSPHERSPERIVDGCLHGEFGDPSKWKPLNAEYRVCGYDEVRGKPVRLKSIEVENFRAFRKKQHLNLDADLVVLFGPNGLGKTSVFDAIDFVCTAGVARFDEKFLRFKHTNRLVQALRHLDSSPEDSIVRAALLAEGKEVTITRSVGNRTRAYVGNSMRDRKETLMALAGIRENPPDMRVDTLIRLFRASHLFGQEFQSLTREFQDDSLLPRDTVSRMLALQDYVETVSKIDKINSFLEKHINKQETEVQLLKSSLSSAQAELDLIGKSSEISRSQESIRTLAIGLAQKISSMTDTTIPPRTQINKTSVKGWRLLLEQQISSLSQDLEKIETLERAYREVRSRRLVIKQLSSKIGNLKAKIKGADRELLELSKREATLRSKTMGLKKEEKELAVRKENLSLALQSSDEHKQLKDNLASTSQESRHVIKELAELMTRIQEIHSTVTEADRLLEIENSEIAALREQVRALIDFEIAGVAWLPLINRRAELQLSQKKTKEEAKDIEQQLISSKNQLETALMHYNALALQNEELLQYQSERQILLDKIQRYVVDKKCPVCGMEHESKVILMRRIGDQKGAQPKEVVEVMARLRAATDKTAEFKTVITELEIKLKKAKMKEARVEAETKKVSGRIRAIEDRVLALELNATPNNLKAAISDKKGELTNQISLKLQKHIELLSRANSAKASLADLIPIRNANLLRNRSLEAKIKQLNFQIEKLRNDALTRKIPLQEDLIIIRNKLQDESQRSKEIIAELRDLNLATQQAKTMLQTLREQKTALEKENEHYDRLILESRRYLAGIESLARQFNMTLELKERELSQLKESAKQRISEASMLRDEVTSLEIGLDSAQASAAMATAREKVKETTRERRKKNLKLRELAKWLTCFQKIRDEVNSKQNTAISIYAEEYGPLTSNIQKRLRSVYGFGEVHLITTRDQKMAVRVERESSQGISTKGVQQVVPSDYFSQSQLQIIMLSLFMSAALTQNWSSFEPILLDDPVTHFDDMNTYSLVDLIKGLILERTSSVIPHQFIVSTCEDRFFRLLRQKFSGMKDKSVFYMFESIGKNGPQINQI